MKERDERYENIRLENTDIFLLENSSCSRRRARKFLQTYVLVSLVFLITFSLFSFSISSRATVPTLTMTPTAFAATADTVHTTADNYNGLVKCSGVAVNSGEVTCNFQMFISTISSVIKWLFIISVPVAVAIFAYAALLHMSGTQENKKKARTIFLNVAIGFIIMLVAFVVVQTVLGWVLNPGFGATTFLGSQRKIR